MTYFLALCCVFGMALGQILFKISAVSWKQCGTLLAVKPSITLLSAMALYGVVSLAWVWILQRAELGKIYPFMALAFVLVPLGSNLIFHEQFEMKYYIGVAFIIIGIVVTASS